jgi:hypothetical protein
MLNDLNSKTFSNDQNHFNSYDRKLAPTLSMGKKQSSLLGNNWMNSGEESPFFAHMDSGFTILTRNASRKLEHDFAQRIEEVQAQEFPSLIKTRSMRKQEEVMKKEDVNQQMDETVNLFLSIDS